MGAFNIWLDEPPPRRTVVWVKYKLTGDNWQLVKTCNHGCCVIAYWGCMKLPKYWYPASQKAAQGWKAQYDQAML